MYFNINCKHFSKTSDTCKIKFLSVFGVKIINQRCNPNISQKCEEKEKTNKPKLIFNARRE